MSISGISGLLGLACTNLPLYKVGIYAFLFFLSYGFGQALTDCFQIDTDKISSPYRPLVQGLMSKRMVGIVSLSGLLSMGAFFSYANPWNLLLSLLAIGGLATYSYFKRKWWAGPAYNAAIVTLIVWMGYCCGTGSLENPLENPRLGFSMLTTFFAYSNFVLMGYYKDIEADRQTGYLTLPVIYGRRVSAYVCVFLSAATITLPAIYFLFFFHPRCTCLLASASFCALYLLGVVKISSAQIQLFKVKTDEQAYLPILGTVLGYLYILGSLVSLQRPDLTLFVVVDVILCAYFLKKRPCRHQI